LKSTPAQAAAAAAIVAPFKQAEGLKESAAAALGVLFSSRKQQLKLAPAKHQEWC